MPSVIRPMSGGNAVAGCCSVGVIIITGLTAPGAGGALGTVVPSLPGSDRAIWLQAWNALGEGPLILLGPLLCALLAIPVGARVGNRLRMSWPAFVLLLAAPLFTPAILGVPLGILGSPPWIIGALYALAHAAAGFGTASAIVRIRQKRDRTIA